MLSVQRAARKSRSTSLDRKLRIGEIEAAFTRAGLEQDYRTLVETLGEAALAQAMTERWLHLTIRDLLADEVSEGVDARRLAVGVAGAPR